MINMPSLEETKLQLNYELSVYREQISMIKRETERISLTSIDLNNALKAAENMRKDHAFVPIGGGAMIKTDITQSDIMVPIGGQYMVEMNKEEAASEIKKRIEATKKAVERLTEEFDKIASKLKSVSAQLKQIQLQTELSQRVDDNIREDYR